MYQSRLHCNFLAADFRKESNPNFDICHLPTCWERKIHCPLSHASLFEPSIDDSLISSEPQFGARHNR
jgi:hypothetical protein